MKISLFFQIIFSVLLAFTVSSFVYFGFTNNYSSDIFNHDQFITQFQSGIYQYRFLSSTLLIAIYNLLESLNIDYSIFKLKFLDNNAEPQMFLSFYILNTIFLMLTAVVMVFITQSKCFIATQSEKILLVAVAISTVALSEMVIVPYDIASYFMLMVYYYVLLIYIKKTNFYLVIILGIIIVISTLIRESSALLIAVSAAMLFLKYGMKREFVLPILFLSMSFLIAYFGIRFYYGHFAATDGILLFENLTQPKNYLGVLFWMVFLALSLFTAKDKSSINAILLFHAFSLPYFIVCFYSGVLYEIRLYIPVFITSLLLGRTELTVIR